VQAHSLNLGLEEANVTRKLSFDNIEVISTSQDDDLLVIKSTLASGNTVYGCHFVLNYHLFTSNNRLLLGVSINDFGRDLVS
jgi:hypothetical protein